MVIHWGTTKQMVRVLLDTGCSVPLISKQLVEAHDIPCRKRTEKAMILRNCSGEQVKGAGLEYTVPLKLQHRRHLTMEVFEVVPLEPETDVFLPYWWIVQHPPQGAWDSEEMRFSSAECLDKCTRFEKNEFSLTWDDTVATDPAAATIGYVSTVSGPDEDPMSAVPTQFHRYLGIMGKEAADALPDHRPYDCKIDLKEGSTAPWGPIYPLSETELGTLREWLKEMLKTGKIQRSTSSAGSPILFVPKPNGRGLRLCVDYRALNRITIPNRYPLPLMQELQDPVQQAQ